MPWRKKFTTVKKKTKNHLCKLIQAAWENFPKVKIGKAISKFSLKLQRGVNYKGGMILNFLLYIKFSLKFYFLMVSI